MNFRIGMSVFHVFNPRWHGKIVDIRSEGLFADMLQVQWETGNQETQFHPAKFLAVEGSAIQMEQSQDDLQSIDESEPENETGIEQIAVAAN